MYGRKTVFLYKVIKSSEQSMDRSSENSTFSGNLYEIHAKFYGTYGFLLLDIAIFMNISVTSDLKSVSWNIETTKQQLSCIKNKTFASSSMEDGLIATQF